jgi:hypothetical protein
MARYQAPKISYSTDEVFAAACAAQRINGEYLKNDKILYDTDGYVEKVEKIANKKLTSQFLRGDFDINDEDRALGQEVRQYCNSLTFKILQGKTLSEFEQVMLNVADKEMVDSFYEIAVISSLPASHERYKARAETDRRVRDTNGFVGDMGDKVDLKVNVMKCFYSRNWNVHFITAITENNESVFFSSRVQFDIGKSLNVRGTVKSHRDGSSQLSHVKVL